MPSPVGHMIAGIAAGWLVVGAPVPTGNPQKNPKVPATFWREAALFGALGALPDVDLLVGIHSGPTHSLGAGLVVGVAAFLVCRRAAVPHPLRLAVACAFAYTSHVLLDWLGNDSTPPIGIMALWPLSRDYFESDLHLFRAISRRYFQGWTFVRQNAIALATEIAILGPVLALVVLLRSRAHPDRP